MQDLKQPPDLDPTGPAITVSTIPPVVRECAKLRAELAEEKRLAFVVLGDLQDCQQENTTLRAEIERWRESDRRLRAEIEHQATRANRAEWYVSELEEVCDSDQLKRAQARAHAHLDPTPST
jgi:hypothetical protein